MVNVCIACDEYNIRPLPAALFHFIRRCGQECSTTFTFHSHNIILPHSGEVGSRLSGAKEKASSL
jgi:hypothetical protein